jgi:hypothetical protein
MGFMAGVLTYFVQLGPHLPIDAKGWGSAGLAAAMFAWGVMQKDGNVSHTSNPMSPQVVSPVNEAKANTADAS